MTAAPADSDAKVAACAAAAVEAMAGGGGHCPLDPQFLDLMLAEAGLTSPSDDVCKSAAFSESMRSASAALLDAASRGADADLDSASVLSSSCLSACCWEGMFMGENDSVPAALVTS